MGATGKPCGARGRQGRLIGSVLAFALLLAAGATPAGATTLAAQLVIAATDVRRLLASDGRAARSLRIARARRVSVRIRAVSVGLETGPSAAAAAGR